MEKVFEVTRKVCDICGKVEGMRPFLLEEELMSVCDICGKDICFGCSVRLSTPPLGKKKGEREQYKCCAIHIKDIGLKGNNHKE